jgi:hypothetical protein
MPRKRKEKPAVADQNPPDKQQNPPQPAQQPPQQPAQGQPQPQAQQGPPQHQQALAAAGLDWGRLVGLALPQILALIRALLDHAEAKAGGVPPS